MSGSVRGLEKKSDESDISLDGTELENLEDSPSED